MVGAKDKLLWVFSWNFRGLKPQEAERVLLRVNILTCIPTAVELCIHAAHANLILQL